MNSFGKIGTVEAIAFIVILITNRILLNVPKEIIHNTGNSAWITVIIISIIVILFTILICKLFKNFPVYDLIDISEYLGGKWLKILVSAIYVCIFIIATSIILRNFSEILKSIVFPSSPIAYILLFFIIGIVAANKLGFSVISRINLVITSLSLVSVLVIFFFPANSFVTANLFPILGYGINETFFSGLTNLFAFGGLVFLFFIPPFLKDPSQFKKISLIAIILSSIYLFLSVISLLLLFSFILNSEELLSVLLASRIIQLGNFVQNIDAIFIFIWIFSFLSYLSITYFFALHVLKKVTNISETNGMVYCLGAIIFGIALLPQKLISSTFLANTSSQYSILIATFVIPTILLILANLKFKRKNKLTYKKE